MDIEAVLYTRLKAEFKNYFKNRSTLRRGINAAKRLYYLRTFALLVYRNDIKQT